MKGHDCHFVTAMNAHRNRPLTLALVVAGIDKTKAMSTTETAKIDKAADDFLTKSPDKSPACGLR